MGKNKINYKEKSDMELKKALSERKAELRQIRFGDSGARARNTKRASNLKKDVARIMTEINHRKIIIFL